MAHSLIITYLNIFVGRKNMYFIIRLLFILCLEIFSKIEFSLIEETYFILKCSKLKMSFIISMHFLLLLIL